MNAKKNLMEFIPTLGNGGAEALVREYCLKLNKEKTNLVLFTIFDLGETANKRLLEKSNIKIITVYKKFNFFVRVFHKLFGKKYIAYKLLQAVKKYKIKIIHGHLAAVIYMKEIANKLKNISLFFTVHNEAYSYLDLKEIDSSIRFLIKKGNLTLIALHNRMLNELKEIYSTNRVVVLFNGIDIGRFQNCVINKIDYRKKLSIPENAFVIGNIGRFSPAKNHELIIDVFFEFQKIQKNGFLLLIGDGELRSEIEEKIQNYGLNDKVLILSNRKDIPEILKTMDVFFFPSTREGFPISLIEAQAVNLPCIVSDKITEEAFLTNKIMQISLDEKKEAFVDALCNFKPNVKPLHKIEEFDMKKVMANLEKILFVEPRKINKKA